jgi:hypothetical protein
MRMDGRETSTHVLIVDSVPITTVIVEGHQTSVGVTRPKQRQNQEDARRSEKAKVPEDGGLINQVLIGLKTYERLGAY